MYLISILKHWLLGKWSSQSKTNLRNSFWGGLDYVVSASSIFLLIPILLKTIGQEMFGIMVIVNTIMGFTGLVSFGLGQATLKYVSEFRATGEVHLIREVIRATLMIYCGMGVVACAVALLCAEWLAIRVFSVSPAQVSDAVLAIQVGSFGFLAFLIFGVGENAWKGFERFDVPVIVRSVTRLLTLVGQVVLALSGFGLAWLVGVQVGLFIIASIVMIFLVKRQLVPDLSFSPLCSFAIVRRVFSYGFYTYLSGIFGMLRQNGDTLIVGAILGPAALALYVIPIRLLSQMHGLLGRLCGFLLPYIGKLHAHDDQMQMRSCYYKASAGLAIASTSMITPLAVFSYPVLDYWLGSPLASETSLLVQILALRFTLYPLGIVNSMFLMASGLVKPMMFLVAFNSTLELVFISLGAWFYGLEGAAVAQLVFLIPVFLNRTFIEKKIFGVIDLRSILGVPLIMLMPLTFLLNFDFSHFATSVIKFVVFAIAISIATGLFVFSTIKVLTQPNLSAQN